MPQGDMSYYDKIVIPRHGRPDSPVEGEAGLYSMLRWNDHDEHRPRPSAGLVALNWTADTAPGRLYNGAATGQQRPLFSLTVGQLAGIFDALAVEGVSLRMIYFSGVDPAGHPQLGDFIALARARGVTQVGLQCDVLRIAHEDGILDRLTRLRPHLFVEFDGFDETASLILHGRRDLPYESRRGLDRLAGAGLTVALLASVVRGVNLQEVGAIAAFGLKHPAVVSTIFRPAPPRQSRMAGYGQGSGYVCAAGIMQALEQQSDGLFCREAFAPVLCCRPARHFVAQIAGGGRPNGSRPAVVQDGRSLAGHGHWHEAKPCFWLGVHDFMTPWSKDLRQAPHCPLVILTPDGRRIPYCLHNAAEEQ